MQQHAIDLGYAQLRSVPNHPNYYLGCDTTLGCPCLTTGIEEVGGHEFQFNVAPNPTSGNFKITYLLPQNQPGKLEVFDINGRRIYEMNLPHWSTMQEVSLPKSISSGVYNCVITSGGERGNKRWWFIRSRDFGIKMLRQKCLGEKADQRSVHLGCQDRRSLRRRYVLHSVSKNQFLPRYNGQAAFGSIPMSGVETNRWVGTIGTTGLEKCIF
ncbi:MAG: T9SS type A sorting domain-containing protein [Bacteroidetes bacterium]|nr:T9SS type A sorting domain-containing protein [Bacteroidota bacterium]